jgi:hypothetical protein
VQGSVKPFILFGLVFGLVTFVVTAALGAIFVAIVMDRDPETILAMAAVITPVAGLVGLLVGTLVTFRTASSASASQAEALTTEPPSA